MTKESQEQKDVKNLFTELISAKPEKFPPKRQPLTAPDNRGVYVICDPTGRVVHVGGTPTGKRGIAQRLENHLSGSSSFTYVYLKGDGSKLRDGYTFRCLPVPDARLRAFLEAYAIGHLCPAHIGLHQPVTGG